MAKDSIRIVEKFSIFEKLFYIILGFVFYPIKYITLLPFFILNGSFRRSPPHKNVAVCVKDSDDERIYRNISSKDQLKVGFCDYQSITDILRKGAIKDPQKHCIGSRCVIDKKDYIEPDTGRVMKKIHFGTYTWRTFEDTIKIVDQYSYGLISIELLINPDNKAAIFADNCEEWFLSSQAILSTGCQLVTVYTTLPDDSIIAAINSTNVTHIVVDDKSMARLLNVYDKLEYVKYVILMSSCNTKLLNGDHPANNKLTFYTIQQLCTKGDELISLKNCSDLSPTNGDTIAIIMFTSGSSGTPKGVQISHMNVLTQIGSEIDNWNQWSNKLYAAFLPSSHILEFVVELSVLAYGGTLGFCTPLTLTDKSPMVKPGSKGDLSELHPNVTLFVPLLLDRLSKAVIQRMKEESRFKQTLIQFLINYKKHFLQKGHQTLFIDKVVFSKIAALLGGISDITISAGAPLSPELSLFSSAVFCLNLKEGYGTTETCCGGSLGLCSDPYSKDVGQITQCNEIKLIPWNEGGYHPKDQPNPRGEIVIGGGNVSHGYYKNEVLTNESFHIDENGTRWFKTGDIGQLLPTGRLQIIDRKKDIVKLKHGEYVGISQIESIIIKSKFVDLVCVAPNEDNSYLVALIVPNRQQIINLLESMRKKIEDDFSIHINDPLICDFMIEDLKKVTMSMNKFDRPEKYIFVCEIWTPESNLLTPSMKLKRKEIQKLYQHHLE